MKSRTSETSPLTLARVAGFLYFLVVPLGIFGALFVSSRLIVSGDAAATAGNILASESLFRLGIVSELLATIVMALVVVALYQLLKPVDRNLALVMVMFVAAAVPIAMLNKLTQLAALVLLRGPEFITAFTAEQVQALALLFLRLNGQGNTIAFIFWGLWLLPLGVLVFKSGFLPRILGILLVISSLVYAADSFATLLGYRLNIGMFGALGEMLFILWLLIKGVNARQWERRALASA